MGIWKNLKNSLWDLISGKIENSINKPVYENDHPISSFLDISTLELKESIVCRGSDIELPYVLKDCTYVIYNSNTKTKVRLSEGKIGKIISIRNLTDSKLDIYFKKYLFRQVEINQSAMFLIYDNFDETVFLPVYLDRHH